MLCCEPWWRQGLLSIPPPAGSAAVASVFVRFLTIFVLFLGEVRCSRFRIGVVMPSPPACEVGVGVGQELETRNSIISNERFTLMARTGFISLEAQTGVIVGRDIVVPQAALDVNGGIAMTEVNVWDGKDENDLTWNGRQISREGSSRRYKKNIRPLKTDFHKILDLEPKQFQMKEGFGEPDEWLFGYIAEDLDELGLKRLCNYDKDNRPDGIKYKKIAMYVLEIAKEQQKRITHWSSTQEMCRQIVLTRQNLMQLVLVEGRSSDPLRRHVQREIPSPQQRAEPGLRLDRVAIGRGILKRSMPHAVQKFDDRRTTVRRSVRRAQG